MDEVKEMLKQTLLKLENISLRLERLENKPLILADTETKYGPIPKSPVGDIKSEIEKKRKEILANLDLNKHQVPFK